MIIGIENKRIENHIPTNRLMDFIETVKDRVVFTTEIGKEIRKSEEVDYIFPQMRKQSDFPRK